MRKSDLLHFHIASQKCFSDEESQRWVNSSPHSTTFVYKEIIAMFNTPNTTFLGFFREKSHHSSSSVHVTTYIRIFFFGQ